MKTNFTKGEWFIGNNNTIQTDEVECIAIVHGPNGKSIEVEPEHKANAKLIAAAPDLLEALNVAFDYIGIAEDISGTHVRAKAIAAIKKATE